MKKTPLLSLVLAAGVLLSGCTAGDSTLSASAPSQPDSIVESSMATSVASILEEPDYAPLLESGMFEAQELSGTYDESTAIPLTAEAPAITQPGTYVISGTLTDTTITIEVEETEEVQLVLDNAVVENSTGPAIYVSQAGKVYITALDGTNNTISDGKDYTYAPDEKADSAIFCRSSLVFNGGGSLSIAGNTKHAVESKDDLIVAMEQLSITAEGSGLKGKDSVRIAWGDIHITSGGDAIKSDNEDDPEQGFIYASNCNLTVESEKDGIQAETTLTLLDGIYSITTGGGAQAQLLDEEESYKGLKAGTDIVISGGDFTVDALDDAIHADNNIAISGGTLLLSSGDDGIHADMDLSISGGDINITESCEGLEGAYVNISGGNIQLIASDDGINASGDLVEESQGPTFGGTGEELNISGGYVLVNANGDGLDSNGTLTVSGGVVLVTGPVSNMDGALDSDGEMKVTGGIVIAAGSSGMPQSFSVAENQGSIMLQFDTQPAGTSLALCDETGNVVVSFTPPKEYGSVVISAPDIQVGNTYTLVVGGEIANTDENGFGENTTITGGETLSTIEMTDQVYSEGGLGGFGGFGGPGGGGRTPGGDTGGTPGEPPEGFSFPGEPPEGFSDDFSGTFHGDPPEGAPDGAPGDFTPPDGNN